MFLRFVVSFSPDKHKLGEKTINCKVNMNDIIVPSSLKLTIDIIQKLGVIETANDYYLNEDNETTSNLLNKIVIKFKLGNKDEVNEFVEMANQQFIDSKLNLLMLF